MMIFDTRLTYLGHPVYAIQQQHKRDKVVKIAPETPSVNA